MSRDRCSPIRLGGADARSHGEADVLSLEALGDQPITLRSAITIEDWDATLQAAGFTEKERAYVIANKLHRIPRRALVRHLGWDRAHVEAVRVRVQRRFAELKAKRPDLAAYRNALEVAYGGVYWESLSCGRVLSMRFGSDPFARKTISFQDVLGQCSKTQNSGGISIRPPLATGERMLEQKLQQAKLDSARVWGEITKAEDERSTRQLEASTIRKELDVDEETSVLEGRPPSAKLVKRLAEAEGAVQAAEKRVEICRRAAERAQAIITALEGEIAAGRFERFQAELDAGPGPRLRAALEEFVSSSIEAFDVMRKHNFAQRSEVLFPGDSGDAITDGSRRNAQVVLLNDALKYAHNAIRCGQRKAS